MAKYQITRRCGHTETIALFGKTKQREWALEKAEESLCADCYHAQIIAADQQAVAQNASNGLPELTGSEKQILWAEKIRADKLDLFNKIPDMPAYAMDAWWSWHHFRDFISDAQSDELSAQYKDRGDLFKAAIQLPVIQKGMALLKAQIKSSWWIDNRDTKLSAIISDLLKTAPVEQPPENKQLEANAQIEATVRPESPITETVAEISVKAQRVQVTFPEKVESFRLLMRSNGYAWSGHEWVRNLNTRSGSPVDRAAEIANILLSHNFIIRLYDHETREKAVTGSFENEQTRWITAFTQGDNTGRLCVSWGKDEDFYKAAKRIPTARYDKPNISVSAEHFEELLDFAEINSFKVSEGAQQVIEAARITKESALVAHIEQSTPVSFKKASDKPGHLDIPESVEVDRDLLD